MPVHRLGIAGGAGVVTLLGYQGPVGNADSALTRVAVDFAKGMELLYEQICQSGFFLQFPGGRLF